MLTVRLSRPLSKLPGKTPSFSDRENGTRRTLLFSSSSSVPVGRRTYADTVNPVGSKALLVTGCDSGFGFSLAKHLHSKGFLVFAGCLLKLLLLLLLEPGQCPSLAPLVSVSPACDKTLTCNTS
uniref:3-hydroxybutyrate dehydrogenase n=1 Tax=Molossus molossus TaxID=27622 RepID=A0A7J8HXU6_MOLMO|nr:3-hydroxybutyrate dehydrogenase 1 [Molossus molossus]